MNRLKDAIRRLASLPLERAKKKIDELPDDWFGTESTSKEDLPVVLRCNTCGFKHLDSQEFILLDTTRLCNKCYEEQTGEK